MKKLILVIFFLAYGNLFAKNMRDCLVLPILDPSGDVIGHQVYLGVENHLKSSSWCYYRPNSEIINILNNYQNNLKEHLQNPAVLSVIADKTNSGSLIKIQLEIDGKGNTAVEVKVIGENGKDLYFKEKTQLKSPDINIINQTINNWLDLYASSIPFDGVVIGILGQQFTINIGDNLRLKDGDTLEIVRPSGKHMHPLLKEIVQWDTQFVAAAKVNKVSTQQSVALLDKGHYQSLLRIGDWVRIKHRNEHVDDEKLNSFNEENSSEDNGKLGQVKMGIGVDQGEVTSNYSGRSITLKGKHYSLDITGDLWIMRHFWLEGYLSKGMGRYDLDGTFLNYSSSNISTTIYKVLFGYKYLPLGFFYGPQIDIYLGYANYSYDLDYHPSEGFSNSEFSGALLGTRAEVPVYQKLRPFVKFELLINPGYKEDQLIYGKRKSSSSYSMNAGVKYELNNSIDVVADWFLIYNSAKFNSPRNAEIIFKNMGIGLSCIYSY